MGARNRAALTAGMFVSRRSGRSICFRSIVVTAHWQGRFDFQHANREEIARKKGKAGGSECRKECDSFAVVFAMRDTPVKREAIVREEAREPKGGSDK